MTFIVQDSPNHCLVNSVSFISVWDEYEMYSQSVIFLVCVGNFF